MSNNLKPQEGRILGIDPGTASVGFGVLDFVKPEGFTGVASGIIQTPKDMPYPKRLNMIRKDMLALLHLYLPEVLVVEAIFFFKNAKTLVPVSQARGVIIEAGAEFGVPICEYTPMQVKLNLTGFGRADKNLVGQRVAQLLNHDKLIKPDDAADAMALAICHARNAVYLSGRKTAAPLP